MNNEIAALETFDLFGKVPPISRGLIADRFMMAPFSVLNAREGWWQERKQKWIGMGIKSEIGRHSDPLNLGDDKRGTMSHITRGTSPEIKAIFEAAGNTTSIFDPVICEMIYRWFCPYRGQVVDPFAGGSVRGIVALALGRQYWGCDLRSEQVSANDEQAAAICDAARPQWICADAIDAIPIAPNADLIFSCPPYGDLERYSDDSRDLSTMEYHTFIAAYKRIILRCYERLKPDRFACFVVGEFRDKRGHYRNFVGDTVAAFMEAGFHYYNEAILVTAVGSLPIRIDKQFSSGRKLGKTHQNVLVFVKGDAKRAADNCDNLEID